MQLVGMLDSPYVRRAAIALQLLDVPFEHRVLSVFSTYEQFRAVNPVVKAPTLVCDDGSVLMDSTLIIDYAHALAPAGRTLLGATPPERLRALRVTGLALAACEKSVQIVYEHELRPAEKLHQPWLARVTQQLLAAYATLEAEFARAPLPAPDRAIDLGGLSAAVAWHFTQRMIPQVVEAVGFPLLQRYSEAAERTPAFAAAPHGDGAVTLSR